MGARNYSEHTARAIDEPVKEIIAAVFERALKLLGSHREALERAAQLLLERETLTEGDLAGIAAQLVPAGQPTPLPKAA